MTTRKTRNIHILCSRIPLPEIYSSIPEAFRIVYAGETEVPDIEAVSALAGAEVGWIAVIPGPGNLRSWLVFERICRCVAIPDAPFGDNIHEPMQRPGS